MTAGSQEEALEIAGELVRTMLVACVNVVPGVTSIYRWEGQVAQDQEWLLIAKTRREVLSELIRLVQELHSYDVPEIVALPLVDGSHSYLRWLDGEVQGGWHQVD
jgi:periplasmic divalent cation tolerance protein